MGGLASVECRRTVWPPGAAANDPRLQALASQRQQWVTSHVGQIQAAMGLARFQKLDSFVRVSSTVNIS